MPRFLWMRMAARATSGHCGVFSWQDRSHRVAVMKHSSQNALASAPMAAVGVGLLLALGCLTRVDAAPTTLVANVVSHFLVHEGGSTVLEPQVHVQCSAPPGVQCRTLIQNNRLIINVYQDHYRGESTQSLEETDDDNTVVDDTFRWFSSKPDRMSTKSNIDTKLIHEAEQTSTQYDFESDDTENESLEQTSHEEDGTDNTDDYRGESFKETHEDNTVEPLNESLEQTSHEEDGTDNTGDDFHGEAYDSSNADDTKFERSHNFENSGEDVAYQDSELQTGEDQSEDHGSFIDNELSNDDGF